MSDVLEPRVGKAATVYPNLYFGTETRGLAPGFSSAALHRTAPDQVPRLGRKWVSSFLQEHSEGICLRS